MTDNKAALKRVWSRLTSKIRPSLKGVLTVSGEAILGIVIIAATLNSAGRIWPDAYRWLTKWANQPPLPVVTRCTFKENVDYRFKNSPNLSLRSYTVSFVLDASLGNKAYGVVYTEDPRFGPYPNDYDGIPNGNDPQYLLLPRKDYSKNTPQITAIFDAEDGELDMLEYELSDCPIKLEFIGGA